MEAIHCIYEGEDAFLQLWFDLHLDHKQSELGTRRGRYTVVLVVLPLVSPLTKCVTVTHACHCNSILVEVR